jgi:polysaccharide deacetylase family protein (PEP-CTERM system associated)
VRVFNALTVDVEENFHATEVGSPAAWWPSLPSRVCGQTTAVLSLLDRYSVRATFFILGWVAERHPEVARDIAAGGHEIGCHSYAHRLVTSLTPAEFREDTRRAVAAIEDACGVTPRLYRAPSYSITAECLWALEVLAECGFTHDSSIYPIRHDRYGIPDFGRQPRTVATPAGGIVEIPVATTVVLGRNIPAGGGGYLRLLPYRYTAAGIRRINAADRRPACVYFHPWELDTGQPRLAPGRIARWRTYAGIRGMRAKLERLLGEFSFAPVSRVYGGAPAQNVRTPMATTSSTRNVSFTTKGSP